jgi:formylglycine-generating enzyme required for sulfatase activity
MAEQKKLLESSYWQQTVLREDQWGQQFAFVPATSFIFGEDGEFRRIRAPFCIGKYPVTCRQFRYFLRQTGYDYDDAAMTQMERISPDPDCPATPISWMDAKIYVRWLRSVSGEYYSLPTEEEWEIAARGTSGKTYAWGNEYPTPEHGCFASREGYETTAVAGSYPRGASPYGCMDMCGGVWEWCLEDLDEEGETHLLCGGCGMTEAERCTVTARAYSRPASKRVAYAGFRLLYLPGTMLESYRAAADEPD